MSNFELPPLSFDLQDKLRPPVQGFGGPGSVQDPERTGGTPATEGGTGPMADFGGMLAKSLGQLGALQDDVKQKTRGLVLGEDVELHDVMLATSKSEVAFNLMIEVRNKLVDAWEKLSRSAV